MTDLSAFYYFMNNAVRQYPLMENGLKCKQPQTFAVLDSTENVNDDNLGKYICDKNKPYFFSRLWHNLQYNPSKLSFEYPAVFVFEQNGSVLVPFNENNNETTYRLQVMVLDVFNEDCDKMNCAGCKGRVRNEILDDTETILYTFLNYLKGAVILTDGDDVRYVNEQYYNHLKENDLLNGFVWNEPRTNSFRGDLRRANQNLPLNRHENLGKSKLYGTSVLLTITLKYCDTPEFSFELSEHKEIIDKGCC